MLLTRKSNCFGTRRNCLNTSDSFRISSLRWRGCGRFFDHQTRRFILIAQLGELLTRQLRIDAVVVFGVVVFGVLIFFVVVLLFARQFRTDVGRGWGDVLFRVRIDGSR